MLSLLFTFVPRISAVGRISFSTINVRRHGKDIFGAYANEQQQQKQTRLTHNPTELLDVTVVCDKTLKQPRSNVQCRWIRTKRRRRSSSALTRDMEILSVCHNIMSKRLHMSKPSPLRKIVILSPNTYKIPTIIPAVWGFKYSSGRKKLRFSTDVADYRGNGIRGKKRIRDRTELSMTLSDPERRELRAHLLEWRYARTI